MSYLDDARSAVTGALGDSKGALGDIGKDASKAIGTAVASMLQPKIDTLVAQAKVAIGKKQNKPPQQVTELEIAYYFSNMPSGDLNATIAAKADLVNKSLRNTLLISAGVVGIALIISGLVRR